ncbi:glycoside hydrolase family 43 protein [Luteolibacter sp. GHJ8]|uniref:Glycoside hydrolase family 43 protein n=1 Tax=Luteolibacter rhizosphaerae TaxID=2989719 RepID=A0ABT3FZU7_9BACT|nr:glycoside hydrolase family 43 protein [Luteolibacter rhizosphaerae]MCW1913106.1 glycoside hydrolase family 43 protein [Luteolibacter rhizosphaerae]
MTRTLLFSALLLSGALADTFVNPIAEGADPCVIKHGDKYIWCQSAGNQGVALWVSDRLTSLGTPHVVWQAPATGPYSKEVWAPELQFIDGKFYIYVAASDGKNANHLAYALESEGVDPLGPYKLHGPFATGEGKDGKSPNIWAIDMYVFKSGGKLYAVWSGWDKPGSDQQYLYIAPMKSPVELAGPRVLLAKNDTYLWERTEEKEGTRGLAEGPQILEHEGRTFLIYSTAASWLPTYKLGLLELTGKDPLDPASWKKHEEPVFRSTDKTFGTGHGGFVQSPDGKEWWHIFHAKRDRGGNWKRSIFVQPFTFKDGFPDFGQPVAPGSSIERPSGERLPSPKLPVALDLRGGKDFGALSYYGHQQFLVLGKQGVELGAAPKDPVNDYRTGEKLVLDGGEFTDFTASTTIEFLKGERDAGLLLRVTDPSVGFDAQRGYFAGVIPGSKSVVFGKTDGTNWKEIARAEVDVDKSKPIELSVTAKGQDFTIAVGGKTVLSAKDDTYAKGSVGLRVVDTHVRFETLEVK